MSHYLVDTRPEVAACPASIPAAATFAGTERRRAGRIENASPELISLMRNPASKSARMRVALYDAPGFLLPAAPRRPRATARTLCHMAAAVATCSLGCTGLFKAMLILWG